MVDVQDGVPPAQLQRHEVGGARRGRQGPVVEDESVGARRDELEARVACLALREGWVPRPAVAPETVTRLFAVGPVKAGRALAAATSHPARVIYSNFANSLLARTT